MPIEGIDIVTAWNSVTVFECALSGTHKEVPTCACGENKFCHNCGYGTGCIPCSCSPPIILGINFEGNFSWVAKSGF